MANIHLNDWFAALPDPHFPCQCNKALKVAKQILLDVKPKWNICLGDIADLDALMPIARFESRLDLLEEYTQIENFLDELAEQGTPLTHLLEGNHEARVRKAKNTKAELRRILCPQYNLELEKRKIKWVPYDNLNILHIRGVTFLHGFSFGKYAAADHAREWGTCVFGHTHRFQILAEIERGKPVYGYNIGWLGDEAKIGYRRMGKATGWQQGMAIGRLPKSGKPKIYPVLIDNGKAEILEKTYRHSLQNV